MCQSRTLRLSSHWPGVPINSHRCAGFICWSQGPSLIPFHSSLQASKGMVVLKFININCFHISLQHCIQTTFFREMLIAVWFPLQGSPSYNSQACNQVSNIYFFKLTFFHGGAMVSYGHGYIMAPENCCFYKENNMVPQRCPTEVSRKIWKPAILCFLCPLNNRIRGMRLN